MIVPLRVLLLPIVISALVACDGPRPQGARTSSPVPKVLISAAERKALTDEAMLIWFDLVESWHKTRDVERLSVVAKARNWQPLSADMLKLSGAERGFAFRYNDSVFLIGDDSTGGSYGVASSIPLNDEIILRQLAQTFDVREVNDSSEMGVRSRMYTLVTGGRPVGVAVLDTSLLESVSSTRISFIAVDRLKATGLKLPPDLARLSDMLAKAESGDAAGQVELGDAYFSGKFGKRDPRLAFDYWRLAAEQKSPSGQHRLAVAMYLGIGTERRLTEAADLFELSANAGDAEAQAMMGWMHLKGDGRPQNSKRAVEWLSRAVQQGHPGAMNSLGALYEKGQGVEQDYSRAVALFREAAAKGEGLAHINLGRAYSFGRGVAVDKPFAAVCFMAAANLGLAEGQYALGVAYLNGDGVQQDVGKAAMLFERAANKGHASAQNNLGLILARGTARPRDLIEGAKWWLLAEAGGSADARANLPEMRRLLSPQGMQEAEQRAQAFVPERGDDDSLPISFLRR